MATRHKHLQQQGHRRAKKEPEICTVCADGSPLSDLSRTMRRVDPDTGSVNNFSCGALEQLLIDASVSSTSAECVAAQIEAAGDGACGCAPPTSEYLADLAQDEAALCTICPRGDGDGDDDDEWRLPPLLDAPARVNDETDEVLLTCANAVAYGILFNACHEFAIAAVVNCGCPPHPEACTLCENGAEPSFPNVRVQFLLEEDDDEVSEQSCSELATLATAFAPSPTDLYDPCPYFHTIGSTHCGCDAPQNVPCPICRDGTEPRDLEALIPLGNESDNDDRNFLPSLDDTNSISCNRLYRTGVGLIDSDTCELFQSRADIYCGCDNDDENGSGKATTTTSPTITPVSPPSTASPTITQTSSPPTCSVCPDGSDIPAENLDRIVRSPGGGTTTCGQLTSISMFFFVQEVCQSGIQRIAVEECGCPSGSLAPTLAPSNSPLVPSNRPQTLAPSDNPEQDGQCTLCFDGEEPSQPGSFIPLDRFDTDSGDPAAPLLCSDAALVAPSFRQNPNACTFLVLLGAAYCGCNLPPADAFSCTLCADGSVPPNLDESVAVSFEGETEESTCLEVYASVPLTITGESDCRAVQTQAQEACGCPVPPSPSPTSAPLTADRCTLCFNGNDPTLPNGLIPLDEINDEDDAAPVVCSDAALVADSFVFGEDACSLLLVLGAAFCGCDPPPPDELDCNLCEDGSVPNKLDDGFLVDSNGEEISCLFLYSTVPLVTESEEECRTTQQAAQEACGCLAESSPPPPPPPTGEPCSLCQNGVPPTDPDAFIPLDLIMGSSSDAISCSDAFFLASVLTTDASTCTFLVFFGFPFCGCEPPSLDFFTCPLCADGQLPRNFDDGSVVIVNDDGQETELSCFQAYAAFSNSLEDPTQCRALQASAVEGCGCDKAGGPRLPTVSPSSVENDNDDCVDNDQRTFKLRTRSTNEWRKCRWLEKKPARREWYCANRPEARERCPEACGIVGGGQDQKGKRVVPRYLKETRTCVWVRSVPNEVDFFCQMSSKVRNTCRLSCNSCANGGVIAE